MTALRGSDYCRTDAARGERSDDPLRAPEIRRFRVTLRIHALPSTERVMQHPGLGSPHRDAAHIECHVSAAIASLM
jgi:hypothetical protein